MHLIILFVFLGQQSLLSGWQMLRLSPEDAALRSTFSIGALPAARSTGPSTTKNVTFSVGKNALHGRDSCRDGS